MIEKLNIGCEQSVATNHCFLNKINEVIDAFNKQSEIIKGLTDGYINDGNYLASLREMVNIHEKEIDELQMKIEPQKTDYKIERPLAAKIDDNPVIENGIDSANKKLGDNLDIAQNALIAIAELFASIHYTPKSYHWYDTACRMNTLARQALTNIDNRNKGKVNG